MKFPSGGYTQDDFQNRKVWLEKKYGIDFNSNNSCAPEDYIGLTENHFDNINLPLSVAGPLCLNGTYITGEFYVPLCTLEGTLTYSMMRGLKITSYSGGIKTYHVKQELSRSPIITFKDVHYIHFFIQWVKTNFEKLKAVAESTTRHGCLLRIDHYVIQNRVILDCVYDTKEAAGQNMVTFATQAMLNYIRTQSIPGLVNCLIEANFNGDKNSSHRNLILGRGHTVVASTLIPNKILKRFLRIDAEYLHNDFHNAYLGSIMAGTSPNLHIANALAAIYLATGQDVACVTENSSGVMSYEYQEGDLYVHLTMPSITVGTVGGACRLPVQKRNLQLLGCYGENSSKKLAEIICAATLALEISLTGAISSHEFTDAHLNYGRSNHKTTMHMAEEVV
jgi:hydroxymethylglutaryl-CoA reductase (NADPH)